MEPSLKLDMPEDMMLQAAVGRVAIRHGQLDHVLRMTIKTILGMNIKEAMRDTHRQGSYRLRERIRQLAQEKIGNGEAFTRLDTVLKKAEVLTDKRNKTLHNVWARTKVGELVIRDDESEIKLQPTTQELDLLANEIARVTFELNEARLRGFLADALAAIAAQ